MREFNPEEILYMKRVATPPKREEEEQIRERVVQFKKMKYMNYVDLARHIDMPQKLMSRWVNQKTTLLAWFQEYVGIGTCKYHSYDHMLDDITSFLDDVEARKQ